MKKMLNEMKLTLPALSANEGYARYAVSSFASQLDPTLEEIADIRTVVSEAVTNAIIHGYRNTEGNVYIHARYFDDRSIVIKIKDKGCGIPDIEKALEPFYTGDPGSERGGMGFTIMSSFTDRMKVRSALDKGTTVILEKKLHKTV